MDGLSLNQPLYLYQMPMFAVTVSTVVIIENYVVMVKNDDGKYRFPGGFVKAGQETIQFAGLRYVKEQTGIMLKKDVVIPVDFRSEPERSKERNIVEIGFVASMENFKVDNILDNGNVKLIDVDFEKKKLLEGVKVNFYMDHNLLLERALDFISIMK